MALDLHIRVVDTETGTPTDMLTVHDLTAKELGMLHMFEDVIQFGGEIIKLDVDIPAVAE
jgi:hypothetical protein